MSVVSGLLALTPVDVSSVCERVLRVLFRAGEESTSVGNGTPTFRFLPVFAMAVPAGSGGKEGKVSVSSTPIVEIVVVDD